MTDFDAIAAAMTSALGGSDEETFPKIWLDTGYGPLNYVLSKSPTMGFPGGRIIEIAGPAASGKTLLATLAMIACQRAGGFAIFIDWERAFNAKFAEMLGLDTSPGRFLYKRSETWEQGNTVAMQACELLRTKKMIAPEAPITVILDSVAAAVPKSVMFDKDGQRRGIDEQTMNDTTALARVTSTTLKSINQLVGEFDVTTIYLNQIRTKPGVVYGDPRTTPGGGAMEFYASQRLFTGRKKVMATEGGEKVFKGAIVGMETVKNKLAKPFQSVDLRLDYADDGRAHFNFTLGYIEELCSIGALEEKAGRVTWEGKSYYKSQLADKLEKEGATGELAKLYVASLAK